MDSLQRQRSPAPQLLAARAFPRGKRPIDVVRRHKQFRERDVEFAREGPAAAFGPLKRLLMPVGVGAQACDLEEVIRAGEVARLDGDERVGVLIATGEHLHKCE